MGKNKWTTDSAYELSSVIDHHFHSTGRDAVADISALGSGAIDVAAQNPAHFEKAASYSGYPSTGGVAGCTYISTIMAQAGGSSFNMWGTTGSPHLKWT